MNTITEQQRERHHLLLASAVVLGLLFLLVWIVRCWPQQSLMVIASAAIAAAWVLLFP